MICKLCNKEIDKLNLVRHTKKCEYLYTNKSHIIDDYVNKLLTAKEVCIKYRTAFIKMKQFLIDNGIHFRNMKESIKLSTKPRSTHTQETKNKLSVIRTQFLTNNPDKHPWKLNSKFKSVPCEKLKSILKDNDISFIDEYMPFINGKLYSIDVAFPDKKIGLEINGNQHYNADGTLKEYYQKRHDIICSGGWKLYEYHYSLMFNNTFIENLINTLKSSFDLGLVDYSFYIKLKKVQPTLKILKSIVNTQSGDKQQYIKELTRIIHLCINGCGSIVHVKGDRCRHCYNMDRRKVVRPSYDQLILDLESTNYCTVGKKYGVSDNAIRKWMKNYEKSVESD